MQQIHIIQDDSIER